MIKYRCCNCYKEYNENNIEFEIENLTETKVVQRLICPECNSGSFEVLITSDLYLN